MAWTAQFKSFDPDNNVVQVNFTNGTATVRKTFNVPPGLASLAAASTWLKAESQNVIQALISKDTLGAAPNNANVTPDPEAPPDPDQSVKDTFLANVDLLGHLNRAIEIGLVLPDDPRVVNLKANMQSQFNALTPQQQLKVVQTL